MKGIFATPLFACAALLTACGSSGEGTNSPASDLRSEATSGEFGGLCVPNGGGMKTLSFDRDCSATYGGRARVVGADVLNLVAVNLSEAGPLPAEGGVRKATLLTAEVPGLLRAKAAEAKTIGIDNEVASTASVLDLDAGVLGIAIRADVIESRAFATCGRSTATSTIANLRIGGIKVEVTGAPNQIVSVGLVTVIINEQRERDSRAYVSALHITAPGLADVVVSESEASVDCSCSERDRDDDDDDHGDWTGTGPRPPSSHDPRDHSPPWTGPKNPGDNGHKPGGHEMPDSFRDPNASQGGLGAACNSDKPCESGYRCAGGPVVK